MGFTPRIRGARLRIMDRREAPVRRDSPAREAVHLILPVGNAPMAQLVQAQSTFLALLREVARQVAGTVDDPVTWVVATVRESSLDQGLTPVAIPTRTLDPETVHRMVEAVPRGVAALGERAERPRYFTDRALELTQTLSGVITENVPFVRIRNGTAEAEVTRAAGVHAQRILDRPYVSEIGSVEGRMEAVNIHGTKRYFTIYDDLTGSRIECYFARRIAVENIAKGIDRRVAVTGEIRSRESGEILSVVVTDLDVFPPDEDLASARDVFGILTR